MYVQLEMWDPTPHTKACDEMHFDEWLSRCLTKLEMHRVSESPAPDAAPSLPQLTVGFLQCSR